MAGRRCVSKLHIGHWTYSIQPPPIAMTAINRQKQALTPLQLFVGRLLSSVHTSPCFTDRYPWFTLPPFLHPLPPPSGGAGDGCSVYFRRKRHSDGGSRAGGWHISAGHDRLDDRCQERGSIGRSPAPPSHSRAHVSAYTETLATFQSIFEAVVAA